MSSSSVVGISALICPASFDLPPVFVSTLQQRHIVRVLEVRLADDSALSGMGTVVVYNIILFEAQHAVSPIGEKPAGSRTHRAHADYDNFVMCFFGHFHLL